MKKNIFFITLLSLFVVMSACKKEDKKSGDMGSMDMGNTKIVVQEGIQAAFDLSDAAGHEKMMKMMGKTAMPMKGMESDHYVTITLMNKSEKKIIKGADVKVSVTVPDNKTADLMTHIMEGMGMYHYAAGFNMKAMGEYKVKAVAKINGKDYTFETSFSSM